MSETASNLMMKQGRSNNTTRKQETIQPYRQVQLLTAPQHSNGDLVQPCTKEGAGPGKLLVETVTSELHVSQLLETAWLAWPLGVLNGSP